MSDPSGSASSRVSGNGAQMSVEGDKVNLGWPRGYSSFFDS